jgi:predicted cupin superfamily sugar epimerase
VTRAAELIAKLDLRPHPEGGYYRQIFRSAAMVTPADGRGTRSAATTIYFLLAAGMQSRWHVVSSDEVWHLYEGGPLELLEIDLPARSLVRVQLAHGDSPVHTIPAGHWQAARPLGEYALVGCTVAPGFEFEDFRLLADDPEVAAVVRATWPEVAVLIP